MEIGSLALAFKENRWEGVLDHGDGQIEFYILSRSEHAVSEGLISFAASILSDLSQYVDRSMKYVEDSVYQEDISRGAELNTVVVEKIGCVRIWYQLFDTERMLGVEWVDGQPVSIYCDSP